MGFKSPTLSATSASAFAPAGDCFPAKAKPDSCANHMAAAKQLRLTCPTGLEPDEKFVSTCELSPSPGYDLKQLPMTDFRTRSNIGPLLCC